MQDSTLDKFGEDIIHTVRDSSIERVTDCANGKYATDESKRLQEFYASLSGNQKSHFDFLVAFAVDSALFRILRMAEQEVIGISYQGVEDISELSDGLTGEIYGNNGWIKKYSKFINSME